MKTDDIRQALSSECHCATCQSFCEHTPGWFLPEELEGAAALKNLTLEDFFNRHCTVEFWLGDLVFVIRPRTISEDGGNMAPTDPRGRCALYAKGRCSIHANKPFECARASHADAPPDMHRRVADTWRTPEAKALVERLYGQEPQEPDISFLDIFSLLR